MKTLARTLLLTIAAYTPVAGAANILVNPGFETGALAPWTLGNDFGAVEFWNVTSADSHTGTYSATARGNHELVQSFAAVATSDINEVSLWLRMVGGPPAVAFVSLYYSDATEGGSVFDVGTDWTFIDATSLLAAGKSLVKVGVYGCSGCGADSRTSVDDWVVDVGAVPEPAVAALLLPGLLLGFRRRQG